MPNDFKQKFEPARGDLVYGRSTTRAAYYAQLEEKRDAMSGVWYQLDDFNNNFGVSSDETYRNSSEAKRVIEEKVVAFVRALEQKQTALDQLTDDVKGFLGKPVYEKIFKTKGGVDLQCDVRNLKAALVYWKSLGNSRFDPRANRQTDGARARRFRQAHGTTQSPGSWGHPPGWLSSFARLMGPASPGSWGHL